MSRRRAAFACIAFLAVVSTACRPPSEPRPAFVKEARIPDDVDLDPIVFTSADFDTNQRVLYATSPTGRRAQRVSPRGDEERSPAVSKDGRWLAFSVSSGRKSGIYVRQVEGGTAQPVVTGRGSFDHPTWSPDGDQIAYAHVPGRGANWNIFVADVGTKQTKPTAVVTDESTDWYPAWSPDGDSIAFTSNVSGDDALWLYEVGTKRSTKIVDSAEEDIQPAWMPDGDRIVFSSNRELDRWQLFTYDVNSSEEERLIRSTSMDRYPAVSPDGSLVAVSIGYLAVYRVDGTKFEDGSDRWKLSDRLALNPSWLEPGSEISS